MLRPAPLSSVLNEEVSLEGLEGATLDTLWNRLAIRLKMKMPLPQMFCDSVWPLVVRQPEFAFYELPTARKPYEFFDRMQHVDPATGVMKEPKDYPGHRFRYEPIQGEVRGSCECYATRVAVEREVLLGMNCREVDARWPYRFVVVASQKMRESFIVDPNFTLDFTIIQYCMLEWIARARFNGETSQGKYSLLELTKDSSILYYNRKFLTENKLITRQALCQRTGESSIQGMVFHLPRYYNEMKPKNLMITEKVVNILKQRPGYQADYEEIKHIVLGRSEARKWFRCAEFAKYVRTDETVPYRVLYPEAEEREWKLKNRKCEEKQVRVMRLIDPEADVYDLWYKDELPEEDQKDGMLNSQKAYIDMPVLQQAYNVVAASGEAGVSQSALALQMGLDKLNARAVVKNLMRLKAVEGHAVDEGRQRTTKYFVPGLTQQTVSFDKEIQYIQLMNTQIEQQQQEQLQRIMAQELSLPSTSTSSTPAVVKAEASGNLSVTTASDQEDIINEDDDTMSVSLSNTTVTTTALDAITVEINLCDQVTSIKKAQAGISAMMRSKHLSAKVLRRCNQIINLVKEFQVLEPRTILKKINEQEKGLGFKSEACNKSVLRLLGKLAVDKFLKIANVRLVKEDRELSVIYACENSIEEDSKVLQSKIDSAKTRMVLQNPGSIAMVSKKLATAEGVDDPIQPPTGYSYEGTLAKCLRMKLFHEFLFYLIYGHPSDARELSAKEWSRLPDMDDFNEPLSPIYSTDGWKIFIPPLNPHDDYGEGWALITDITIRLPLSIFCQICTFGFYTKELDYYLNHQVRRHMLIKQLPRQIRLQLLRQRKYVYNIYELCSKLCYAGLLQFGPQRAKDRDQTFIYLNRCTALLDTRTSQIGYNEIEDKDYPMFGFRFLAPDDLTTYWETLYSYAMETVLNRRSVAIGKEILVQQLSVKPEMVEASRARTPQEAIANDVQRLPPGDARGAAGMDTAMFIHLKSNWHKIMNYAPAERANQKAKIKRMKTVKKMIAQNKEKAATAAAAGPITARNTKRLTAPKDKKLCLKSKLTVKPFASTYRKYGERKHAVKIRKIESRVSKARSRNIYDEVDRRALKLMKKLRVDWNRHEDAILLLCRIGVHYLFGEQGLKQNTIITSSNYRDILHWTDPASQNKTSRACQRRANYMVKHKQGNAASIKLCVEEAKLNPVIERRFGADFLKNLRKEYPTNEEFAMALKVHFVELVHLLKKTLTKLNSDHFRPATEEDSSDRLIIPNSIPEFEQRFNVLQMQDKIDGLNFGSNPKTLEDITLLKLVTLIHSAVTNVKERTNFNVQLFNIYKNYSEKHLSAAMRMVRSFKMISLTRKLKAAKVVPSSIVPNYDNPYRVSVTYLNQLCTKIPFDIFGLVFENYMRLVDRASYEEPVTFDDGGQGLMLLLAELLALDRAEVELEAPVQYIQVNPDLQNTSTNAEELRTVFSEFPEGGEEPAAAAAAPMLEDIIKAEPTAKKLRFNACTDVCFNYVTHPIEKLTKIPTEYLHFFCLLNSFRERSYLRNYKIDPSANICAMPDCILLDPNRSLITKCIAIALARRETIERLKMSKVSRIEMTPALSLREDNLLQFFTRSVNEYVKAHTELQRRDLGRIADGMKSQINMVELADEIVRFDSAQDFNWLDRYEITQLEDYEADGKDDEADDPNAFSRDLAVRDDVTEKVYKMHNFYVVTYLKINVRLLYDHPIVLQRRVTFDKRSIPQAFLPPNFELRQDILTKITGDALWHPQDELEPLIEQASPLVYQNPRLSALASFIEDREFLGASVLDLADRFRNRDDLRADLQTLINLKFILRTGFRHIIYVHCRYAQPWLIKTSCVVRDQAADPCSSSTMAAGIKRRRSEEQEEEEEVMRPPRKSRRQEMERKLEEAVEKDRYKPKKDLALSMHPWHKVDGKINRQLLYRWLTSLLLYCISHPGVLLTAIYTRFNLMAPVHLYHLLETLQEYGCIKISAMDVRPKRTLFSTYRPVRIEPATEFDREEHSYVESCPNAMTTLTMFIGDDRRFQEDFLALTSSRRGAIDEEDEDDEEDGEEQEDSDKE